MVDMGIMFADRNFSSLLPTRRNRPPAFKLIGFADAWFALYVTSLVAGSPDDSSVTVNLFFEDYTFT